MTVKVNPITGEIEVIEDNKAGDDQDQSADDDQTKDLKAGDDQDQSADDDQSTPGVFDVKPVNDQVREYLEKAGLPEHTVNNLLKSGIWEKGDSETPFTCTRVIDGNEKVLSIDYLVNKYKRVTTETVEFNSTEKLLIEQERDKVNAEINDIDKQIAELQNKKAGIADRPTSIETKLTAMKKNAKHEAERLKEKLERQSAFEKTLEDVQKPASKTPIVIGSSVRENQTA